MTSLNCDRQGHEYIYKPTTTPETIIAQYRNQATDYDKNMEKWGFLGPKNGATLLSTLTNPDARILDAGCGTGLVGKHLHELNRCLLYGVDLSTEMLKIAASREIYAELLEGNLFQLHYASDTFDASISIGVLTHMENSEAAVRELVRVTKPGGTVLLSQRVDLFETQQMGMMLSQLEKEDLIEEAQKTAPELYVTNHKDYVEAGIKVIYLILPVK